MKGLPILKQQRITELREIYRQALLDDVIPFWLKHTLDQENGGYFNNVGPTGEIYDTDKSMWLQGRAVWMLSKLYNTVEKRQEWLDAAKLIYDFMVKHGFDTVPPTQEVKRARIGVRHAVVSLPYPERHSHFETSLLKPVD